jgi:uncharacterized protein YdhG (YjbR/CyaY superfamily)
MNMFKNSGSDTVKGYLANVPPERKETIDFLHKHIQKTAPELRPFFAYNMIGYGKFKYKNYKKEIIDWPIIALANQKNYISIYICALEGGQYIAEKYKDILGKVSVGKSCIRFKKLDDLNLETLDRVIRLAADNPGLV